MQVYLQSLEQYSAFLMSHITKAEIADSEKYHNEKTTLLLAYEKLDQAAADNYRNSYGILIGQKPEVSYGYTQIAPEHLKGSADSEHPGEEASLAVDGKKILYGTAIMETAQKQILPAIKTIPTPFFWIKRRISEN